MLSVEVLEPALPVELLVEFAEEFDPDEEFAVVSVLLSMLELFVVAFTSVVFVLFELSVLEVFELLSELLESFELEELELLDPLSLALALLLELPSPERSVSATTQSIIHCL